MAVAALDVDIKILTTAQEGLGANPLKVMFETVIAVLVLVKVRDFLLFPSLRSPSAAPPGQDDRR